MPKFNIEVKRQKIDREAEGASREHFSHERAESYMADGGETYHVTGLGHGNPDVMQAWTIEYSQKLQGTHGTIERILYASRKGTFERVIVSIATTGTVDLTIKDGKVANGPDWATMDAPIALITLRQSMNKGLPQIMKKISRNAARCIQTLIDTADALA